MASGIVYFRVDDRMLHGIVATQWVPAFKATRVMVVDGPASTNDIMRASLKMACPAGVALSVLAPEKAAANILKGNYAAQRVFCVCRTIAAAHFLFKAGVGIPLLDLGNVTQNHGDVTVLDKTVRVSAEEKQMLREMRDAGVRIIARFALADSDTDVSALLD